MSTEVQIKRPSAVKQIDFDSEGAPVNSVNKEIGIKKDIFYQNPETAESQPVDLGLDLLANKEKISDDEFETDEDEDEEYEYEYEDDPGSEYVEEQTAPRKEIMTEEQVKEKKAYYLHQLDRYMKKGIKNVRHLGMHHSLSEIENEYRRIKKEIEIDSAINYGRQGLMFCIQTVERLNGHFDPVGARLDGWSQQVYTELHNYDDIFEELYEKYHTRVKMMPELKLIFALSASGFMFHIQKSIIEKTSQNGNMMNSLINAMNNLNHTASGTKKEMRGPSMNTDDLLQKLAEDDDSMSLPETVDSFEIDESPITIPVPKKRGRKPKNG